MVWEPQKFLTFELGNTFKLQRITCFFIEPLIRRIPAKPTIITVTLEGEAGRASQRFPKNLSQGMGPSPTPPEQDVVSRIIANCKMPAQIQHQGRLGDTRDLAAWLCLPPCSPNSSFQTSPLLFCLDEEDIPYLLRQAADF